MMKMMMIIAKKGLSRAERALNVVTNTSTGCNGLSKASCPINLSLARVCVCPSPAFFDLFSSKEQEDEGCTRFILRFFCVFAL